VYFDESFVDCPVYNRADLGLDVILSGPAIIEESGSSTIVFPGWQAMLGADALVLQRSQKVGGNQESAAAALRVTTAVDPITREVTQ
jgi:hypothetical protein